jgi:hypothetical protein
LGKGKLKENESVPFEMAFSTIKSAGGVKKKAPAKAPQQSLPVDSSSQSSSSNNNKNNNKNGTHGANGNSKINNVKNGPPSNNKKPNTASAPVRENQNPKERMKNNVSDASLNSRNYDDNDNHSIVPRGIEETFEKVSHAFGNLDSKLKGAAAKLDPNYKQRESNAAAEREELERENR